MHSRKCIPKCQPNRKIYYTCNESFNSCNLHRIAS